MDNKEAVQSIRLSEETKAAIQKDFEGVTGKLEIVLNEGGIQASNVKVKLK